MNDDVSRVPRLVIPDNSPLSLLSNGGREALDFLFVPGVEVWVTDMVKIEATRKPDPGDDQRSGQRKMISDWFAANRYRIGVLETETGREYLKSMTNWVKSGSDPETKPSWRDRGDYSILDILGVAEKVVSESEAAVLLVDDARARNALRQTDRLNLDIVSTRGFLSLLEENFGLEDASDIWPLIKLSAGVNEHGASRVPERPSEDPVFVRPFGQ